MSQELPTYQPRCMHLCCKSMLVYGENFREDPEFQAGAIDFWCQHTGRGLGPDHGQVELEECSRSERECFQEY